MNCEKINFLDNKGFFARLQLAEPHRGILQMDDDR